MSNVISFKDHCSPNKDDLQTFMHVVFGGCSGLMPCRSFAEKGNKYSKPINNIWVSSDDEIVEKAMNFANLANKRQAAFYVIPGTVNEVGQAGSADIIEMQVLLIDIDDGDTEGKLQDLTAALGEPTMIVESGGTTKDGKAKLHVYWQLTKAVSGDDLQILLSLRHKIALAFGGDTHFKSAHQPIRVAGSVYHKGGKHRSVKIRSYNLIEYDLEELVERISCLPELNNKELLHNAKTANNEITSFDNILTSKVYEGGNEEASRFGNLQRVIGYWLRRCHEGLVTQEQALEEIQSYNLANVVPSWPVERIKQTLDGLWKLHLQKYGEATRVENKANDNVTLPVIKSFSLDAFLADTSELPEDIIAPRILTPGGMFVFGGAPKVGKSDFLLSLFVHMAAGKEFLGFVPPRPLKIFYFQAEIGYHYLRERLQNMQLPDELIELAKDNLHITPNSKMLLDEKGIEALAGHIKSIMRDAPDIIAVDPIRNVFDGGRAGSTENENDAMMFFLQKRIEALRDKVNPNAGIVLAHHTKKITSTALEEDPFQAFSGASSLRGYYSTGALLYKPDIESNELHLTFELRNGANIPTKIINKKNGAWVQENALNIPVTNKQYNIKLNKERDRRDQVILDILKEEALNGRAYSLNAFCEAFDSMRNLGSKDSIKSRIKVLIRKGYIKFFKNTTDYGFGKCTSAYGLMCFENMELVTSLGEIVAVKPTHYLHHELEDLYPIENSKIWTLYDGQYEDKVNKFQVRNEVRVYSQLKPTTSPT